jgi:cytochrome c556
MKHLIVGCAAIAATLASLPAAAQFQKPEDAIKYRQSAFTVMANHFGRIGAMAQGKAPFDAKAAQDSMVVISAVHKLPFTAFGDGTDKGGNTKALPEVWSKQAGFNEARDKMFTEMAKLDGAVKSGSFDNVKAAFGGVGGSCKGCHDDYRAK